MSSDTRTREENRPISPEESAVVDFLIRNARPKGSLEHLRTTISDLHVVAQCTCGCASVDFEEGGQSGKSNPIVEAAGESTEGMGLLVILWGREDAVTGLEVIEMGPGNTRVLPDPASLRVW